MAGIGADTYVNAVAITPSDSAVIGPYKAFMFVGAIGATGLKVRTIGGQDIAFGTGLSPNTIIPIKIDRVYATGTTAASIFGLN